MCQTRIDDFLSKNQNNSKTNSKKFYVDPWIEIYTKKSIHKLKKELKTLERNFKTMDFQSLRIKDNEYLRTLVIILNIINEILVKTLEIKQFDLSWQEILQYITSESKNPSFMLKSMIREIKRKISLKLNFFIKKEYPFFKKNTYRQHFIDAYIN